MKGQRKAAGENVDKIRAYCVRCERQMRFAEQPRPRRCHHQWQLTGNCVDCGTPMHQFARQDGVAVGQKKRTDVRHTVKVGDDIKELLQFAAWAMAWSQTEIVEYLVREYLPQLASRAIRDGKQELPPCPKNLLHLLVPVDEERDEDEGDADEYEGEDEDGDEGEDAGGDEEEGLLPRLFRRLTSG
jgi:hypothetical protein